jgi:hypothetical protein
MKLKSFAGEQITGMLKERKAGAKTADRVRRLTVQMAQSDSAGRLPISNTDAALGQSRLDLGQDDAKRPVLLLR